MEKNISFTLKVWRQNGPKAKGHFDSFEMKDIPTDTSFLEMLDILNEQLIEEGKEPFVFDHDCREGICGMCSLYINGHPHGPATGATTCQLYMRRFNDGDVITVEPWRSAAFPVIKDCMVDRGAFDKIIQAGGYVTVREHKDTAPHPYSSFRYPLLQQNKNEKEPSQCPNSCISLIFSQCSIKIPRPLLYPVFIISTP